jgi:uncharacterized membrane protein
MKPEKQKLKNKAMEKINLKKEIIFWVLIVLPVLYVLYVWNQLPAQVPIHFNIHGEPNGWTGKPGIFILPGVNLFIYLLLLFLPEIDPKKMSYEFFRSNLHKIRLLLTAFLSVITFLATNAAVTGHIGHLVSALLLLLFTLLGNFMINLKPNWFIGIRTPWTLSSDTVWKKTHLVFGRIWFYGGAVGFILVLLVPGKLANHLAFGFIIVSAVAAFIYSFWLFKQEEKKGVQG